jgi:hypothetical protein
VLTGHALTILRTAAIKDNKNHKNQAKPHQAQMRFSPHKTHPRQQILRNQGQHIHQGKPEITASENRARP